MLALAVLSEQRFFEPTTPYNNAAAFRLVLQGFAAGPGQLSIPIPRRGGGTWLGGCAHGEVFFQCPLSLYGADAPPPNQRFAQALDRARMTSAPAFARIKAALPLWLLANADDTLLPIDNQLALAAAAFEQLLGPFSGQVACRLSAELSKVFDGLGSVTLSQSQRRVPDPRWRDAQAEWWLHRKWIKELYELRSDQMHGSARSNLSRNWTPEEHQVMAAFVFPLAAKLLLRSEGLYDLSNREQSGCRTLDLLLEAEDWGFGWKSQRRWPRILSRVEDAAELRAVIAAAITQSRGGSTDSAGGSA